MNPPAQQDATEAARKLLSCIYRVEKAGTAFGAGHIIDILRGKRSDKVQQYGHEALSTFGIGADMTEAQWRALLRQLIALGVVAVDAAPFNTLHLADAARPILLGEQSVQMKVGADKTTSAPRKRRADVADDGTPLSLAERDCLDALKAWRGEVARSHNLPAYVIFHDSTLRAIAQRSPRSEADLDGIPGLGQKKREAYGAEVLRVVGSVTRD